MKLARGVLTLLIVVAAMLPWPSTVPIVSADHVPTHDPEARLQIVIKKIVLHDISEPFYESEAEVKLALFLLRVDPSCPAYSLEEACLRDLATVHFPQMDMSEGEVRVIDRVVPLSEDSVVSDGSISTAFGLPVYEGQAYHLVIYGYDEDSVPGFDDFLGRIDRIISGGDGWVAPPNVQRANDDDSGKGQGGPGKFSLEYEIRRIPLPDLEPTDIKILDLPGSPDDNVVCMSVLNRGAMNAGPFEAWLVLDGAVPPLGKAEAGQLPSGQHGELCVTVKLPTSGSHYLTALVDEPRGILEENDTNNRYAEPYVAPQNATGGGSGPAPGSSQADLFASGLSVKGEQSNGTSGCDPGRNDITVSIKNLGGQPAASFVVRLTAKPESNDNDDDEISSEKTVTSLNAGASQDVQFDDVRLKKGFYELAVSVDSKKSVAESDEDNNEFKISVNCQDSSL